DDLLHGWDTLKATGTPFMTAPPATYYEMLAERLPGHGEPVEELQRRGILLDGSTEKGDPRLLLQIFSETVIGPVFFEFIQRKKDEGFGEGNFTALFRSMELDQIRRGTLNVAGAGA
ncbi:MAG: 4-hydroxyphenylpyruvate dioxygenase, partial [Sphingomonadales bacterium]|nr:4-hydroxyphenylpyruvate dioxygenase [Sphingomonadales bacterium]